MSYEPNIPDEYRKQVNITKKSIFNADNIALVSFILAINLAFYLILVWFHTTNPPEYPYNINHYKMESEEFPSKSKYLEDKRQWNEEHKEDYIKLTLNPIEHRCIIFILFTANLGIFSAIFRFRLWE